jgi:hypothetical protein
MRGLLFYVLGYLKFHGQFIESSSHAVDDQRVGRMSNGVLLNNREPRLVAPKIIWILG